MLTGVGTSCPHIVWSDAPFENGGATDVELSSVRHHYHCPLTRTMNLGAPPEEVSRTAEVVVEGVAAALTAIRPGARAVIIEKSGVWKNSRVGYRPPAPQTVIAQRDEPPFAFEELRSDRSFRQNSTNVN